MFMEVVNVPGLQSYNVPAGFTAVLKDMVLDIPHFAGNDIDDVITVALDLTDCNVWRVPAANIRPGTYRWTGTQTFNAVMHLTAWTHVMAFRASGYLLTNP